MVSGVVKSNTIDSNFTSSPVPIDIQIHSETGSQLSTRIPEAMESKKDFDFILLGPTGYTGRLCARHIVQHFPTNLKWALAGRSVEKLDDVASELKQLNPDRAEPGK